MSNQTGVKINLLTRVVLTALFTLMSLIVAFIVAFIVAAVGINQYLEDFCFTTAPLPPVARYHEEMLSGGGLYWENLITFRCQWNQAADVVVKDFFPLGWILGVAVLTIVSVVLVWWLAVIRPWRRRPRSAGEGQP